MSKSREKEGAPSPSQYGASAPPPAGFAHPPPAQYGAPPAYSVAGGPPPGASGGFGDVPPSYSATPNNSLVGSAGQECHRINGMEINKSGMSTL